MHPNLVSPFTTLSSYILDPSTGDVYVNGGRAIGRWSRSSNTFTTLIPTGIASSGYTMSAFDTSRGRIFILGNVDQDHHLYTLSSNEWSTVPLSGANASDVFDVEQGAMVYVAALDLFLIRRDVAGGTVYQVNASTFEVTTFATTAASIPSTQNGPYNKFLYVPRLRGAVYVPSYFGNAWFLRLH
jgi:hypothetical protein